MRNASKLEMAPVQSQTDEGTDSGERVGQGNAKGKRKALPQKNVCNCSLLFTIFNNIRVAKLKFSEMYVVF